MNKKEVICPECKGTRGEIVRNKEVTYFNQCWYCTGTGFETDEDESFREFWREK